MTDDLEQFGQALRRQTPPPGDGAKERALAAAMENFYSRAQGSEEEARPTSDRPHGVARILEGLKRMKAHFTTRAALMGTASVAAVALAVVLVQDMPEKGPITASGPVAELQPAPAPADEEFEVAVAEEAVTRAPAASSAALADEAVPEAFNNGESPETDLSRARMADATDTRTPSTAKAAAAAPVAEPMVMAEAAPVEAEPVFMAEAEEAVPVEAEAESVDIAPDPFRIYANLPGSTLDLDAGDVIDIYWTGTLEGAQVPVTALILEDIRVLAYDDMTRVEDGQQPPEVELDLTPDQAATLTEAQTTGSVALVRIGSPEAARMASLAAASEELVLALAEEEVPSPEEELRRNLQVQETPANAADVDMSRESGILRDALRNAPGLSQEAESESAAPTPSAEASPEPPFGSLNKGGLYGGGSGLGAASNEPRGRVQFAAPGTSDAGIGFGAFSDRDDDSRIVPVPEANTERFPDAAPSDLKQVRTEPVSTFSIDVDTASYSFVRSSLMAGQKPPAEAVRIEEMVNYFDYDYPMPEDREVPFRTSVSVTDTPWNEGTKLIQIGIQGYDLPVGERPDANLVFLIDTSGSMQDANKLPLLIQSFRLLLTTLGENDTVAIVTYAGSAGVVLEPTAASETGKILDSLTRLHAGGSTAGHAGLQQAYALAERMAEDGELSRVILATDGDFNVGISDTEELKSYIENKRKTGVYLSVLGFGRGNTNDQLMQALAQNGNGTAAYIDTLAEAQKVLVEEASGALFPIANDVKIQMEFNPGQIAEYRLIGYETRALRREDFNNDAVDAGEIGAGHTVTAIYEVTPVGSPAVRFEPLRYGDEPVAVSNDNPEYGFLRLRYKLPGESRSQLIETPILPDRADIGVTEVSFATAVAGFGAYLRGSDWLGEWGPAEIQALAAGNRGEDRFGYRAEFLRLVGLARTAQ